jgi:hypothetical protein
MQLQSGLSGGFALAAWPGTTGTNANASPQGPATAAAAGFGTTASGDASGRLDGKTFGILSVGTLALGALIYIWWALPR